MAGGAGAQLSMSGEAAPDVQGVMMVSPGMDISELFAGTVPSSWWEVVAAAVATCAAELLVCQGQPSFPSIPRGVVSLPLVAAASHSTFLCNRL